MISGNFINIPNGISFLRILLCFPLIKYLSSVPDKLDYHSLENYKHELSIVLIIVFAIILSDILDGLIARWMNNVTDFGKLIDPIADKMAILIVLIYLIQKPGIEGLSILIFFILLICRDFYIGLYAIYFIKKYNISFDSIKSGKWFIGSSAVMFLFFIYDPLLMKFYYIKWYFYGLTLLLMGYSTYEYYSRYISIYKKEKR
mgnify:CR=1 FL=1|tara:strand:- start:471 stop:1076 length:606 start_codon:yes stop_codon:yes gene_type:complete